MFEFLSSFLSDKLIIMECRENGLDAAYQGLGKFGVLLVALTHGLPFGAAQVIGAHDVMLPGDDLLSYAAIPWVAHFFQIDIVQATTLFYKTALLLAFVFALLGVSLYCKNWISRLIAVFFVILCFNKTPLFVVKPSAFSDVYLASIVITLAILPLFLYFYQKGKMTFFYVLFLCFSGLLIGYGEYWRSFSSVPLGLLMLGFLVVDQKLVFKKKIFLIVSLCLGILIAVLHFNSLIHKRDVYLSSHLVNYNASVVVNSHPFWHAIYAGLGYYPNPYGLKFDDGVVEQKAVSIEPHVLIYSKEYNQVLRQAVFEFVAKHPAFVLKTTLKKIRDCLKSIVKWFMWFGVLLFILLQKTIYERLVLIFALMCALVPGIIVVPSSSYITGFFALIYLYTAFGYGKYGELLFLKVKNK